MHILVIFTGGTIGSSAQDGWISLSADTQSQLLDLYQQKTGDTSVQFSTLSPYTLLSENLSAFYLNALIDCLLAQSGMGYDGIIVAHGTDTLQYTAAALSFALGEKLPITLVSADYPLADARSNGLYNFVAAVRFLQTRPQGGVYVSYKNTGEEKTNIHHALRLLAHAETSADLLSLGEPYAVIDNRTEKVTINKSLALTKSEGFGKINFCNTPPILLIDSYPERLYPQNLDGYKAVILVPYHSGTLNTASEQFQAFCLAAKQKGIPTFLVNAPKGTTYDSLKTLDDLGIIPLPLSAKIAIYIKCWAAISLGKDVKEFVLAPLANEFLH